jgi:hypothetical protein
MAHVLLKKTREHEQWLKTRMLKAYLVLPGQIKELKDFQDSWRTMTAVPVDEPANYPAFVNHTRIYMRKVRICLFWRQSMRRWGREPIAGIRPRKVRSPYFEDWEAFNPQHLTGISADHSRGSADGGNTWLDRFLVASDELCRAEAIVLHHPQMVRLQQGAQEAIEASLLAALTVLKAEYAAVYALSIWSPGTRIPDPSRAGRDPGSKWFANGGTFVVWRSKRDGYVPLQDAQGVQAELLRVRPYDNDDGYGDYVDVLRNFGHLLVNLPGDFGDFGARIAAKVASLEAELQRLVLVLHADEQKSPFYPASDEAAAVRLTRPSAAGKQRR